MEQPIIELPTDTLVEPTDNLVRPRKRWWGRIAILSALGIIVPLVFGGLFVYIANQAPTPFVAQTVTVESGENVWQIAQKLKQAHVVQSEILLFLNLRFIEDATLIKAATYTFDTPLTTQAVAHTLIVGQFANDLVAVTFIEGESTATFGRRAAAKLANLDADAFALQTVNLEGQLFPDTYHVPPDYDTEALVALLHDKHQAVLAELLETSSTSLNQDEVVILASIVEREANTPESMRTVAGIFLNRLAIGMPLQADASIEYALETPLGELPAGQLANELRELDTPYNTYINPGLPPTAIGNPGKVALEAVLNPIQSDYFYYLTGDDGEFYYAQTYDQHLNNIARQLR